jgi:hypothetical protein
LLSPNNKPAPRLIHNRPGPVRCSECLVQVRYVAAAGRPGKRRLWISGDVPTKVRKTPRDLAQPGYTQRDTSFRRSQNQTALRPPILGGLIRTESSTFRPRNHIRPSTLICPQDQPSHLREPRILFATPLQPEALSRVARARRMPLRTLGVQRPHASRVNGIVPVVMIPWRFTYLCWNIPKISPRD